MDFRREALCVYTYLLNKLWLLFFFTAICQPLSLTAQVNNTGGLYISGNVYAASNFTNASSAVYRNDGNLYLNRNFSNDQPSMVSGNGTTFFIGSTLQQINGSQGPAFNHVNINNAAGVQMNVNTLMNGTISPVAGSLYFNGYTLTMGGAINTLYTNTAAFNVTASSNLNVTGNAAAGNKLYFAASANTLHNLTLTAGATAVLGNALSITGGSSFGTVISGGSLDAGGFLTLKSDAGGYAIVGVSTGDITNNVTVERFIPARRAWRFLTVPFNSSDQTINQAWQEGFTNTNLNCPPQYPGTPGFGTQLTYNGTNGYDLNTTNVSSLLTWQNNTWTPISSTLTPKITDYPAYNLFIRGDRTVCLIQATGAIPTNTVLRATGFLNQAGGTNIISKTYNGSAGDFFFVGNPYASAINLQNVINGSRVTGFEPGKIWVWDPKLAGIYGVGGYVTYSNGLWVPSGGSYPSGSGNQPLIQSGQAFMVQTNSATATIAFQESDKINTQSNVFGLSANKSYAVIFINLMQQDSLSLLDGVAAGFANRFSPSVDGDDAQKRWNYDENMALVRDEKTLAIEFRPVATLTDTLFLRLYLRQVPYVLKIFTQNLPGNLPAQAWLIDKYLNTETEISLYDTSLYGFVPNTDTNSYRNRFMLVFQRKPSSPGQPVYAIDTTAPGSIKLFPNPVATGDKISMQFNDLPKGTYRVLITDITGKPILNRAIEYMGDKGNYSIGLSATQASGEYIVKVINEHGFEYKTRFVIAY